MMAGDTTFTSPGSAASTLLTIDSILVQPIQASSMLSGSGFPTPGGLLSVSFDDTFYSLNYRNSFNQTEFSNSWRVELPEDDFQSVNDVRDWIAQVADEHLGDLFGTTYTKERMKSWFHSWNVDFDRLFLNDVIYRADIQQVPFAFAVANLASSTMDSTMELSISSGDFSATNVQVQGVDEADLVEIDGKYVYIISGNELIIVDTGDSENLTVASRVRLEGRPQGMYLSGDRLTLVSSGQKTTVTVLDLSDREAPTFVQKTELNGSLVSSRMVDGELRLVLQNYKSWPPRYFSGLKSQLVDVSESDVATYQYQTRSEYLERVENEVLNEIFPAYRSLSVVGELIDQGLLVDTAEILGNRHRDANTIISIVTFDVHDDESGPTASKSVFTNGAAEIHATEQSLYVFGRSNNYSNPETTIWKFDFDGDDHSIKLAAKGSVEGTLLNQFAADEHDGYLRVVTTGRSWRSGQAMVVLEQVGSHLKVVGSVENIAPGERLHSVRFMGDQAFVVTFKKVDPLFAIDLSDPENPTIAGELKIPGYSDYLQPLDENHLLGIGRDADITGGLFRELQISIFDVSDLDDPQLAHRYSFDGGRSTASIATGGRWSLGDGDHHAVGYFPSAEILAIPIFSADQRGGFRGGVDNTPIFGSQEGGLQVFSVNVEDGFEPLALIEHDSPILRSLRIGDALLAFSAGEISSHDITDPATQMDSLELLVGSDIELVELKAFHAGPSAADLQAVAYRVSASIQETSIQETGGGFSSAAEELDVTRFAEAEFSLARFATNQNKLPFSNADATDSALSLVNSPEEFGELDPIDQEKFEQAVDTVFDVALL